MELILAAFPENPSRLPTKGRQAFSKQGTGCGERSTEEPSYSNVVFRSLGSLPRCSEEDKRLICGIQEKLPDLLGQVRNDVGVGLPLIWQESKSVKMWSALVADLDVGAIFDCSPGSGALAEAAMRAGVHYAGVCANGKHVSWLQSVLDHAALKQIITPQSPLFDSSLASKIKEYFMDIVGNLDMQDGAQAEEGHSDDEDYNT